ncbi:MAG: divergent polysaccharide deacetylase family protein [Candidatus Omnitrophota bacterium]
MSRARRNKGSSGYKIVIGILSLIIIVQWVLMSSKPKEQPIVPVESLMTVESAMPVESIKGRIAIVIDDWGYNLHNLAILKEMESPITLSILPNLAYSKKVAEEAHNLGLEMILHLPMEPHENYSLEEDTIMVTASDSQIRGIIKNDLASIIYAKGVSNHMGSKVTEDPRVMKIVFNELKKRGLYFFDSLVSADSLGSEFARSVRLDFLERDIFLDNQSDPAYIKEQINKLKLEAGLRGSAIGVGHDRKTTLGVLMEELPKLEAEGYKLVFLSELIGQSIR